MLMSYGIAIVTEEENIDYVSVTSVQWVKIWGYIASVSAGTVCL